MEEIELLEREISSLEDLLREKQQKLNEQKQKSPLDPAKLSNYEINRYSRQLIVPEIGVEGQLKIRNGRYLIVGAGGLGCPVLAYLIGAGALHIGIVDYDEVELNNLPRQFLHKESYLGKPKTESLKDHALKTNAQADIQTFQVQISDVNALELLTPFDVVIDCTDNVATRYLLNDACILLKKPLVSGSALQMEGQLTVYNYNDGPCYRCIFPTPPPPETVSNCSEGGILGAITGTIGALQALEALKIVGNFGEPLNGKLLLLDGLSTTIRSIKLRPRRKDCVVCSEHPTITKLIKYEQFCGMKACDRDSSVSIYKDDDRITAEKYKEILESQAKHLLIDVRSPMEFQICKLKGSVNIPLRKLMKEESLEHVKGFTDVYCLCRRGNDSQLAVEYLRKHLKDSATVKDIKGGLYAWQKTVDNQFPLY